MLFLASHVQKAFQPKEAGKILSSQDCDPHILLRHSWLGLLTQAFNSLTCDFGFGFVVFLFLLLLWGHWLPWFKQEMSPTQTHRRRTFGHQLVALLLEGCGTLSE